MRRMRFLALGIVSFVVAIVGTLLVPGTFFNRAFSAALCTLFSFNWTFCTVDLGGNSQRVVAANPPAVVADISDYLQAQRDPSEFGDEPSTPSPQQSNPQAPPFPQDPGPNFPVRDDFNNGDGATQNSDGSSGSQARVDCNLPADVYSFYINGIRTDGGGYDRDQRLIENLLAKAGVPKPFLRFRTHNPTGVTGGLGDLVESIRQGLFRATKTPDGKQLIDSIVQNIERAERSYESRSESSDCNCKITRPKYVLIGHSQGNFFVEDIANALSSEVQKRTVILSFASFTDFKSTNVRAKVKGLDYLLRPDDFPSRLQRIPGIAIPGEPNLPPLTATQEPLTFDTALEEIERSPQWRSANASHSLANYLGSPTAEENRFAAGIALNLAIGKLKVLLDFDSGKYDKDKKKCSPTAEQPPQPQQTAQQSNLTRRNCRVPKEFFKDKRVVVGIRMDDYICVIREPVMTDGGPVDGVSACGTCDIWGNFGSLPKKSSCNSRAIDPDRSNQVPTCPSNWYGGS